jgi:phosphoglycolate phosphatase
VVQSLLTGNIPALARVKLGALGLTEHLDLSIGAYGDVSEVRADLVPVARQNAARRYEADFSGTATVLVGDTPKDIEAAAISGARAVAVASGNFTMQQLRDAGAEVVLPDLTDTAVVVGALCSVEAAD